MPRELRITIAVTVPIPETVSADAFREADFINQIGLLLYESRASLEPIVGDMTYEWDAKARIVTLRRGESEPTADLPGLGEEGAQS